MKIHTTVGAYKNGGYKVNGVPDLFLEDHIEYNKTWRFGRALFVDGKCVYRGYLTKEECDKVEEDIKDIKREEDTAPYW